MGDNEWRWFSWTEWKCTHICQVVYTSFECTLAQMRKVNVNSICFTEEEDEEINKYIYVYKCKCKCKCTLLLTTIYQQKKIDIVLETIETLMWLTNHIRMATISMDFSSMSERGRRRAVVHCYQPIGIRYRFEFPLFMEMVCYTSLPLKAYRYKW